MYTNRWSFALQLLRGRPSPHALPACGARDTNTPAHLASAAPALASAAASLGSIALSLPSSSREKFPALVHAASASATRPCEGHINQVHRGNTW